MLDWLTLKMRINDVSELEALLAYRARLPQIQRVTPETGELHWSVPERQSIRSDTHQVQVYVGGAEIEISGSPARSMGLPDNVFGSDDLWSCVQAHLSVARSVLPFPLPGPERWRITRADVTYNYDLGGASEVRQALAYLRQSDGGRYKVRAVSETVYWSPGSTSRSGKAYHKGPHLRYLQRHGLWAGDVEYLRLADRLLRLELRLGRTWWARAGNWWELPTGVLWESFEDYWSGLIGADVEVAQMGDVLGLLLDVAETESQARAAYRTWRLICSDGHRAAQDATPRSTWYRHLGLLRAAGLSWGDLAAGQVVPFRRSRLVVGSPVTSWDELRRSA